MSDWRGNGPLWRLLGCGAMLLLGFLPVYGQEAGEDEEAQPPAATQPAPTRPADEPRLGAAPPEIGPVDRFDLSRLVRKSMARKVRDGQDYEVSYVPPGLESLECRASVTFRRDGRLVATADSESLPVMQAVMQVAQAALSRAGEKKPVTEDDLEKWGLEIELSGPSEPVGHGGEPAEYLAVHFEPGIHGIAVRMEGTEVLVRPSQLISFETFCHDGGYFTYHCDRYRIAIRNLQEKLGLLKTRPDRPPDSVGFRRFRTTHWYQASPEVEPVLLIAGMRPVTGGEITSERLRREIDELGRYLRHRQSSDGLFSYEFLPGRDIYWAPEQNWVRQAGTTWVMARYARVRGDEGSLDASKRAIAAIGKMVRAVVGDPRGSYVHTADSLHTLGTAGLYALALMDSPEAERHADVLASLMAGIESMQLPDGQFRTHFPPSRKQSSQDYYPGEALLAVARYYRLHPDADRRALCDKALEFYTKYFRQTRVPAFIPWQAQAWGEMARTTRLQKYADFVFEMTDHLVGMQIPPAEMPLAIYDGGIDTTGSGRAGVSTTVYLEGIVDAIRTAELFGDTARAARYRQTASRAVRFIVQLRFREEECYYVQSPREVVGGLRNTPIDPTLRIDHVQHALAGLMGAAEVLGTQTRPAE